MKNKNEQMQALKEGQKKAHEAHAAEKDAKLFECCEMNRLEGVKELLAAGAFSVCCCRCGV